MGANDTPIEIMIDTSSCLKGVSGPPLLMSGFLLIDKPAGPTSHDVLNILKKKTGIKRMGHSGTLDPFATGLLVVGVGEGVKFFPYLVDEPKVYTATLKLGEATDTLDREGKVVETKSVPSLDASAFDCVLKSFLGRRDQLPPMYSARKIEGKKLYELAREGKTVERKPREIEIFDIGAVTASRQTFSFRVTCSRGTYVRVLGADIAKALGTVGHLTELRREKSGSFAVTSAVSPKNVSLERDLIPILKALKEIPPLLLTKDAARSLMRGQIIPSDKKNPPGLVVLMNEESFLGVGTCHDGQIKPVRLMSGK